MVVKGYIDHFLFFNPSNGYGVIELDTEDEDIICVGNFAGISQGTMVEITGEYTEHPTYGPQLKVSHVEESEITDILDMERYLSSGAIKGVGPSIAKRIVKKFGEDTFRIMEEEPERLTEIKGISERIAREIATQIHERKELRDTLIFLQKYGISNHMALKLYDTYGAMVQVIIKENPYKLADDVDGIGFRRADEIASKIGIRVDAEQRIACGIEYVLSQASQDGHTYLPVSELISKSYELLSVPESAIESQLPNLQMERRIVIKKEDGAEHCYQSKVYYEELAVAQMITEFSSVVPSGTKKLLKVFEAQQEGDFNLDNDQQQAVKGALSNGVFILTGGPGTGKTTTINAIIKSLTEVGLEILLAAPTGRAAKRMTETTSMEAKTIHRLLELTGSVDGKGARFERNQDNPLEADVVIIDEMSMVDIHLFYSLMKAILPGTRLILVGDTNQLPSVGPGQVFKDLCDCGIIPKVSLKKIYRQEEGGDIATNAHRINNGEEIRLDTNSKDFLFLQRDNVDVIYKHMVILATEKLPGYVGSSPMQIQVLTPTKIGALGAPALNKILQQYMNPPDKDKKEMEFRDTVFREGDKVMQIKNNYNLEWEIKGYNGIVIDRGSGVFNGDMGVITGINSSLQSIEVEYDECRKVSYSYTGLDELELAYAVTIHKSQGSEYPAVIMPLLGGPRPLMNRNLLYTGVTRAQKCVTILGSKETVMQMINNEDERKRYTGLSIRIREVERNE